MRKSAIGVKKLIFNSLWLTICTVNYHQERGGTGVFRLYHFLYFEIRQFLDNGNTTHPRILEKLVTKKIGFQPLKKRLEPLKWRRGKELNPPETDCLSTVLKSTDELFFSGSNVLYHNELKCTYRLSFFIFRD